MLAKDHDKGNFDPIPEDTHVGVCVGVIDLGTQHNFKFKKYERKCLISFELPDVHIEIEVDGETKDVPRFISRRFTLSLGASAHLRKFLRTWRGRDFTPTELEGFEMKTLLGVPANIQVLHDKKDDRVYSNIDAAGKLLKGQEAPKAENEPTYFSFDDVESLGDVDSKTEDMPEWIQNLIQKSQEYKDLARATTEANTPPAVPAGEGDPIDDSDIPF